MAKAKTSQTSVERRAEELDTIASVLPLQRRDELAELLIDQDIETLRHLVNQGMRGNTLRADLRPSYKNAAKPPLTRACRRHF
ncbi:integrase-like protein [Agrobacterium tumefaciens]|nr:integrase-like protein [Agrobacterium tumefaciens]